MYEKIKEMLKAQGYVGKLINYTELQMLYKMYGKDMPEYKFAQDVLEISGGLYGNMKYSERKKATILKSLINQISQDAIDNIKENLETCIRIPMLNIEKARSLNLSNSVAIVVYEALRQLDYPGLR